MRTRWITAGTLGLLALASTAALAQGRGRDRGADRVPPGQAKKAERQERRDNPARFDDHDREIARNWYVHERRDVREDREEEARDERAAQRAGRRLPPGLQGRELPPGLRDRDRLPPGLERRVVAGYLLDADDRRVLYPAPVVLVRLFPPPPPGFRYFAFGGHIILVDNGYRVRDVIHLEMDLGR